MQSQNLNQFQFRGDTRPLSQVSEAGGFKPLRPSEPSHSAEGIPNPGARVCFSYQIDVAARFPLNNQRETHVHIVKVPRTTPDYDDFSQRLPEVVIKEDYILHMYLQFGDEANVPEIPLQQIIGTFKCVKQFFGEGQNYEGIYQLSEYVANPVYPDKVEAEVTAKIAATMLNIWRPLPSAGYCVLREDFQATLLKLLNAAAGLEQSLTILATFWMFIVDAEIVFAKYVKAMEKLEQKPLPSPEFRNKFIQTLTALSSANPKLKSIIFFRVLQERDPASLTTLIMREQERVKKPSFVREDEARVDANVDSSVTGRRPLVARMFTQRPTIPDRTTDAKSAAAAP